ncbi:MAG: hypothetical protein HQK96_16740, partial [Nitrospirae bacterium]|nr:hypothetical protein [Nitrospirota bacterium]
MKIEYLYCNRVICGYNRAASEYIRILGEMGHTVSTVFGQTKPDVRIIHDIPYNVDEKLFDDCVPVIYFYAWELSELPEMYVETMKKAKFCVTFSEFQEKIYRKKVGKNIECIPHFVDYPQVRKTEKREVFTFLSILRWDER